MTTNSVQFGAHVDLLAGFDGFGIHGHFSLDALFVFDPFGFMVDFTAGFSVECADFSVASVEFSGHLSGTSPWRIRGHASVSVLWWDVDVDLPEITWGDPNPPPLPPARDPAAALAHELAAPGNWAARSRDVPHLVQLRPGVAGTTVALHPLADLGFTQSAVPINLPLQRIDGVKLGTPVTLRVESGDPPAPPPPENMTTRAVRREPVPRVRRERQARVVGVRDVRRRIPPRRGAAADRRRRRGPRREVRDLRHREGRTAAVPRRARAAARRAARRRALRRAGRGARAAPHGAQSVGRRGRRA